MRQISENLFVYEDTCNVYLLRYGTDGIAIDFGSGDVLDHLSEVGVQRITDVLLTHHHRDQGQGLQRAVDRGVRIWVPHTEQDLFSDVDSHWQAREIMNNYNVRQDRFSLLQSVPISGTLRDYAVFRVEETQQGFTVVPTPGHTVGSISLLTRVDGQRILFTGDLIAQPGKVWSLAATQWTYNGAEGAAASILSLLKVQELAPDVLCPSHGSVMDEPKRATGLLVERLEDLLKVRNQYQHLRSWVESPYVQLTEHLLYNRTCWAKSYVLLSKNRTALIIDFGYEFFTGLPAGYDRSSRRPWLYSIDKLKNEFGVERISAVIPTHYHDDHVGGLNLLRDVEQAKVWAPENFARILSNPTDYDIPCLWYDPIPVDRELPLQTPIQWEEYEITLYPQPGHTLYAAAVAFQVDGKQVVAVGDQQGNDGYLWNYVYKNRFSPSDYRASAELYQRLQPDLILSGHWEPFWVPEGYLETLSQRAVELEALHHDLLNLQEVDLDAEGWAAWIYPYQSVTSGGHPVDLLVEVRNPYAYDSLAKVEIVVPDGWKIDPKNQEVQLGAKNTERLKFTVYPPEGIEVRRARIAADVTVGGCRFGQHADALITVKG